jgi:hypothetical protein
MLRDSPDNNKGVISILKDWAGEIIHQRVEEEPISGSLEEELLEDIGNNVEQEGGEGVPLAEAALTLDPSARNTVEKNCSLTR